MNQTEAPQTYDWVCFQVLAYEFDTDDPKDFDKKLRRKLKSSGLGIYDAERIAVIRNLKNDLQSEIGKFARSHYYLKATGPYASLTDFDIDRMVDDYSRKYPSVAKDDMRGIMNFALYCYYLR